MARVRPLSLDLLRPEWTAEVPSPPHDALSPAQRREHLARFPLSYLGVTRSPEDDDPASPLSRRELLVAGRRAMEQMLARDVFVPARGPRYFLYRLDNGNHSQTGLVAGVPVDDYDTGVVRIHERIKQDRARHLADHLAVVRAQSSPIALACPDDDKFTLAVDGVVGSAPVLDFVTREGLHQLVWTVDNPEIEDRFSAALSDKPLYLIDGHHRAAAAAAYRADPAGHEPAIEPSPANLPGMDWMLSAIFPAAEMRNRAFHRYVTVDSFPAVVDRLAERLEVRPATRSEITHRGPCEVPLLGHDGDGRLSWYLVDLPLAPGHTASTVIDNLDPVRLQEHVLHPVLDIDELQSNGRLQHRPGSDDPSVVEAMLEPGEMVFVMRPVSMAQLFEASDAGLVMPPKSTYFEPKVRSGIFLHRKELV